VARTNWWNFDADQKAMKKRAEGLSYLVLLDEEETGPDKHKHYLNMTTLLWHNSDVGRMGPNEGLYFP